MVRMWAGDLCNVSACKRVYSEDGGDVALGIRLFAAAYSVGPVLIPFINMFPRCCVSGSSVFWRGDSSQSVFFFFSSSLASTVKADPTTTLFNQTGVPAQVDYDKVYHCVYCHGFSSCILDCRAMYDLPASQVGMLGCLSSQALATTRTIFVAR